MTCNRTIPTEIPDFIDEVVLLEPQGLAVRVFCNVSWIAVRKLYLEFNSYFVNFFDSYFACLEHVETLKIKGPDLFFTSYAFTGLNNVTVLDLSESCFDWHWLTAVFRIQTNFPNLHDLKLSRSMNFRYGMVIDQDFVDAVSSRPLNSLDLSRNADLMFDFHQSDALCKTLTTVLLHDSFITEINLPYSCPSLMIVDFSGSPNMIRKFKQSCLEKIISLPIPHYYSSDVIYLNHMVTEYDAQLFSNCGVGFQYIVSIRELDFSSNYLPEFEFLILLYDLESINLSYNKIQTINPNAFDSLRKLKSINLSHNALHNMKNSMTIFPALFRKNLKLQFVDLSWNGLSYLPNETFLVNFELRDVILYGNEFTQLSLDISIFDNLEILDLRLNEIQFLNAESRHKVDVFHTKQALVPNNKTLKVLMAENPFSCDCKSLDFLIWFVTSPIFNSSYRCVSDGKIYSLNALAVGVSEEDCNWPKRKRTTILLSTMLPGFSLVTAVAISIALHRRRKRKIQEQHLQKRVRLIQTGTTGYSFTAFLAYSSIDAEFARKRISVPLQVGSFLCSFFTQCISTFCYCKIIH